MANFAEPSKMLHQTTVVRANIKTQIEITLYQTSGLPNVLQQRLSKRQNQNIYTLPAGDAVESAVDQKEWECRQSHVKQPGKTASKNRRHHVFICPVEFFTSGKI